MSKKHAPMRIEIGGEVLIGWETRKREARDHFHFSKTQETHVF
jgi:hypothetical protein